MQYAKFYVGLKIVTNTELGATIYTIDEINGMQAQVSYKTLKGKKVNCGWNDMSIMLPATDAQIAKYNRLCALESLRT
jgi:hypothetical protein